MRYLVRLMPFTSGRNHDPIYSVVTATSARAAVAAQIGSDCKISGDDDFAYASTSTDNQEDRGESWGTRHEWEAASEDEIRRSVAADNGQYDEMDLEHFEEPTPRAPANTIRAERALAALTHYQHDLLGEGGPGPDIETVTDLLTDILHWREGGLDGLREALDVATRHYAAETEED